MLAILLDSVMSMSNDTDWTGTALTAVKIASAIAVAVFAIFGIIGETRKDGKLTRWGTTAIAGAALSLFFTLVTQSLESGREKQLKKAEDLKEASLRKREQKKLAADIKLQSLSTARIERLLIRTDSINKGLSRTSQQQSDALDSLGLALSLLQTSSLAQNKLLSSNIKLNSDLNFTIEQQRKVLVEQKYTRQDLYKVMNPIKSWSIHTEITYKVYDTGLESYFNRIKAKAESVKSLRGIPGIFVNNMLSPRFNSSIRSDKIQTISIDQYADSTWFPSYEKEQKASQLLNEQSINIGFLTNRRLSFEKNNKSFFSMQSDIKDVLRAQCANKSSDMFRHFMPYPPRQKDNESEFSLEVNFEQSTITQRVSTDAVFSDNRTHGMKSLADFSGIDMEIVFGYMLNSDQIKFRSVSIDWLQILLNNDLNSQFDIYEKDLMLTKSRFGDSFIWKYNFPIQFPE